MSPFFVYILLFCILFLSVGGYRLIAESSYYCFEKFLASERLYLLNNRPISLLPVLSKVCERVAHNQLTTYLVSKDCLMSKESGNKQHHSTETMLIHTADLKLHAMEDKQKAFKHPPQESSKHGPMIYGYPLWTKSMGWVHQDMDWVHGSSFLDRIHRPVIFTTLHKQRPLVFINAGSSLPMPYPHKCVRT